MEFKKRFTPCWSRVWNFVVWIFEILFFQLILKIWLSDDIPELIKNQVISDGELGRFWFFKKKFKMQIFNFAAMRTHRLSPSRLPNAARNDYRAVVNSMKKFRPEENSNAKAYVLTSQYNEACGAIKRLRKLTSKHFTLSSKKSVLLISFSLLYRIKKSDPA